MQSESAVSNWIRVVFNGDDISDEVVKAAISKDIANRKIKLTRRGDKTAPKVDEIIVTQGWKPDRIELSAKGRDSAVEYSCCMDSERLLRDDGAVFTEQTFSVWSFRHCDCTP